MSKKVSVIMPCYNAEKYISDAVESILNQTYTNWELLIIDDGSTDHSLEIVQRFAEKDRRIRYFSNPQNKGVAAARNLGIEKSRGVYLAFLDADDISKPERLKKEVSFLNHNAGYAAVGSQVELINEKNRITGVKHYPETWPEIKSKFYFGNPFANSSMMFRRDAVEQYAVRFDEDLDFGEDFLFWIKLGLHDKMRNLPDILIQYRSAGNSLSHKWSETRDEVAGCCSLHKKIFTYLWEAKKIDLKKCNINAIINTLVWKRAKSVRELGENIANILKYGMILGCKERDKYIYREMYHCMMETFRINKKPIENSMLEKLEYAKKRIRIYQNQFIKMRDCIQRYGDYPYPKYMVLKDKKVIYLEMPKVANCSIKASMLNTKFEDDYSVQKESLKYTTHKVGRGCRDFYKFTFVRNPFERLVSCYESKYHKDKKMIGSIMKNLEYDNYLFGFIRRDYGFTNFVLRIALIPDAYKDHHFKPQSQIVYEKDGRSRVDFVGKYESLNEEYEKISEKYDFDELPIYNKTERKDYKEYYNALTARIAYFIYRKDIKNFGYEKEYRQLIKYIQRKK